MSYDQIYEELFFNDDVEQPDFIKFATSQSVWDIENSNIKNLCILNSNIQYRRATKKIILASKIIDQKIPCNYCTFLNKSDQIYCSECNHELPTKLFAIENNKIIEIFIVAENPFQYYFIEAFLEIFNMSPSNRKNFKFKLFFKKIKTQEGHDVNYLNTEVYIKKTYFNNLLKYDYNIPIILI